jgi:hypothetical protein
MAYFKDSGLSQNQNWIHELVKNETTGDQVSAQTSFNPQQAIEESTIDFLVSLRSTLTDYLQTFNGYSEGALRFQEVKLYSIAQAAADFMVYRNQIKMVVANVAHGIVQISIAHHSNKTLFVDGQSSREKEGGFVPAFASPCEITAQIGPFHDIYWNFKGEKVTPEQLGKYFFSEFVMASRDFKKSIGGNKLILEQIKALLNEKGIDL